MLTIFRKYESFLFSNSTRFPKASQPVMYVYLGTIVGKRPLYLINAQKVNFVLKEAQHLIPVRLELSVDLRALHLIYIVLIVYRELFVILLELLKEHLARKDDFVRIRCPSIRMTDTRVQ